MADPLAMTELYAVFTRGIRYLLLRSLGVEGVDDKVHDCFVIVTEAIRSGELRDPARLIRYFHAVVGRRIARSIGDAIRRRLTTVEFDDSVLSVSDWKNKPEQNCSPVSVPNLRAVGSKEYPAATARFCAASICWNSRRISSARKWGSVTISSAC